MFFCFRRRLRLSVVDREILGRELLQIHDAVVVKITDDHALYPVHEHYIDYSPSFEHRPGNGQKVGK